MGLGFGFGFDFISAGGAKAADVALPPPLLGGGERWDDAPATAPPDFRGRPPSAAAVLRAPVSASELLACLRSFRGPSSLPGTASPPPAAADDGETGGAAVDDDELPVCDLERPNSFWKNVSGL
jgi:hypothetical protein